MLLTTKLSKLQKMFTLLFYVCIFSFTLGQFSRLHSSGQSNLYLFDILTSVFNFLSAMYFVRIQKFIIPKFFWAFISFIFLGVVSLIFTPISLETDQFLTSLAYSARILNYAFFTIMTINLISCDILKNKDVLLSAIIGGLVLFFIGLIQLILLPDLEILDPALGWDPHKNRMVSTFFDPNFLGMYFVICLGAFFKYKKLYINESKNKKGLVLFYASLALLTIGILLTFSRSAWLAFAIFIFFMGLKNRALLAFSVCALTLSIIAVPRIQTRISGITDPQDSARFRFKSWQNTWEIIKDHWVFGVGYNSFRYTQQEYGFLNDSDLNLRSSAGSDSSLLLAWATSGIGGLYFLVLSVCILLINSFRRGDLAGIGITFALLADSIFINSLFYPQILVPFLLISLNGGR